MFDLVGVAFFNRQYLAVVPLHIAIAAVGILRQGPRFQVVQRLGIDLLVLLVDEHQPVAAQAETATAILVDPAAHAEAIRGQAASLAVQPVPDAASPIGWAKFQPEQPVGTDLEFGKVGAGGHGLGRAEFSRGR